MCGGGSAYSSQALLPSWEPAWPMWMWQICGEQARVSKGEETGEEQRDITNGPWRTHIWSKHGPTDTQKTLTSPRMMATLD